MAKKKKSFPNLKCPNHPDAPPRVEIGPGWKKWKCSKCNRELAIDTGT